MKSLEKLSEAAFGQRRKMLRASLKNLGFSIEDFEKISLKGTERPEQLDVETLCKLAKLFQDKA